MFFHKNKSLFSSLNWILIQIVYFNNDFKLLKWNKSTMKLQNEFFKIDPSWIYFEKSDKEKDSY